MRPRALEAGIRADVFDRAGAIVDYLPQVLERQQNQKEFLLAISEYLEIIASQERVRNGRRMLRRHRDLFNRIEAEFGVDASIIAAIWGVESGYGVVRGETPTLAALATLGFAGRRAAFFCDEFIAALGVVQSLGCVPENLRGSWAGALGHGQFMPSAMLHHAVDFDGDGAVGICKDDPTDGLASIANFLAKKGWAKGKPWGFEVRLGAEFDYALAGRDHVFTTREWEQTGVGGAGNSRLADYGAGSILLPAGARGVALLVTGNFDVLLSYNHSEAYAIGVGHLADRLLGAPGFRASWPIVQNALKKDEIAEAQFLLTGAGFDTGGIDGLRGPRTLQATRGWQQAHGLVPDGFLGEDVLAELRRSKPG